VVSVLWFVCGEVSFSIVEVMRVVVRFSVMMSCMDGSLVFFWGL